MSVRVHNPVPAVHRFRLHVLPRLCGARPLQRQYSHASCFMPVICFGFTTGFRVIRSHSHHSQDVQRTPTHMQGPYTPPDAWGHVHCRNHGCHPYRTTWTTATTATAVLRAWLLRPPGGPGALSTWRGSRVMLGKLARRRWFWGQTEIPDLTRVVVCHYVTVYDVLMSHGSKRLLFEQHCKECSSNIYVSAAANPPTRWIRDQRPCDRHSVT